MTDPTPLADHLVMVIPAFEGGESLARCLASIARSVPAPPPVIVVDNASTDGSTEAALRDHPGITLIRNPTNLGFGRACNQGIERAMHIGAGFILLLNQDTEIAPDTITRLIAAAEAQPGAGVLGPKSLATGRHTDGSARLLYAGAHRGLLPLSQRIPGSGGPDRDDGAEARPVGIVYGHAMLLRAEAVRQVGGFDPGFFMYHEDVDLCVRMQAAGWSLWYVPDAVVWHDIPHLDRSGPADRWRWDCKLRSARHFHRKRYPGPLAEFLVVAHVLDEFAGRLRHRQWRAAGHVATAWARSLGGAASSGPRAADSRPATLLSGPPPAPE